MLTSLAVAMRRVCWRCRSLLVAVDRRVRVRQGNIYVTIVVVSLLTAPLALVYGTASISGSRSARTAGCILVLIHLALGGFLFHFMTLPDRSVTLRILVEAAAGSRAGAVDASPQHAATA